MPAELELKALREKIADIGYSISPEDPVIELATFAMTQLNRLDGKCPDTGVSDCLCWRCAELRADLLELQRRVLG